MINKRKNNVKVIMGNGTSAQSQIIGDVKGLICSMKDKTGICATLQNLAHAPEAKYNLFSITCMMNKEWKMVGDVNGIVLTKGDTKLHFNHKINTSLGCLFVIKFPV